MRRLRARFQYALVGLNNSLAFSRRLQGVVCRQLRHPHFQATTPRTATFHHYGTLWSAYDHERLLILFDYVSISQNGCAEYGTVCGKAFKVLRKKTRGEGDLSGVAVEKTTPPADCTCYAETPLENPGYGSSLEHSSTSHASHTTHSAHTSAWRTLLFWSLGDGNFCGS